MFNDPTSVRSEVCFLRYGSEKHNPGGLERPMHMYKCQETLVEASIIYCTSAFTNTTTI